MENRIPEESREPELVDAALKKKCAALYLPGLNVFFLFLLSQKSPRTHLIVGGPNDRLSFCLHGDHHRSYLSSGDPSENSLQSK